MDHFNDQTGEIIEGGRGTGLALRIEDSDMAIQRHLGRQFPRSVARARSTLMSYAVADEQAAQECIYSLPRAGKPVRGPSVRFAEMLAAAWGNCDVGSRLVEVNKAEMYLVAEGVFVDTESGTRRVSQIRRRISDKNGKCFNDDMIGVTANAACSIAMREAVLKGIPKTIWRAAYEAADRMTMGEGKTLAQSRDAAIAALGGYGVVPEQIYAALEIRGKDDIDIDAIATLRSIFMSIKNEEATVESYFAPKADPIAVRSAQRASTRAVTQRGEAAAQVESKPAAKAQPEPEQKPAAKVEAKVDVAVKEEPAPKEVAPSVDQQVALAFSDPEPAKAKEKPVAEDMNAAPHDRFARLSFTLHQVCRSFLSKAEGVTFETVRAAFHKNEIDLADMEAERPELADGVYDLFDRCTAANAGQGGAE